MPTPVELISEKIFLPKKIGRVEVQQSALGVDIFPTLLSECHRLSVIGQTKSLVYAGHRYERVQDGAGVWHYNLYAYYDPVGAQEELPPRNLNEAEQNVLGQTVTSNQLNSNGVDVGMKEQRF